ncbi:platelet glycoprotein IX-like [Acipenser oxyrinchus oxyrinchus]|uniref:Platelet glycoprotein IX-like n=1 Tax=Acipenser oxyrinchus oxyrinchus TaxID=40147 RepID=A0AAD8CX21_ACIOX|nr:platelet glycoprotein IX-like [Acipenser oxyrinchus oxyrinchus]
MNLAILATLLICCVPDAKPCPASCDCSLLGDEGLQVDCSSRWLKEVPTLPDNTVLLYLQNNMLAGIQAGRFDRLHHLQRLDLSQNPLSCDCGIVYLKHWLDDNANVSVTGATCKGPASPETLTVITQLSGNDFAGCRSTNPIDCWGLLKIDLIMLGVFVLLVLIPVAYLYWISKRLACCVAMTMDTVLYRRTTVRRLKSQ